MWFFKSRIKVIFNLPFFSSFYFLNDNENKSSKNLIFTLVMNVFANIVTLIG